MRSVAQKQHKQCTFPNSKTKKKKKVIHQITHNINKHITKTFYWYKMISDYINSINVNKYSYPMSIFLGIKKTSNSCQFTRNVTLLFQPIFNKCAVNIPLLFHTSLHFMFIISNKLTVCLTMKLNPPTGTPPHLSLFRVTTHIYKPTTSSTYTLQPWKWRQHVPQKVSNASHFQKTPNTQNQNKYHYTTL